MRLKILVCIIIFVILTVAFSTSYTTVNIDNIAVVVAMGIDLNTDGTLKICFQFTNPSSISENGSSDKSPSIVQTVTATSINSAINVMNSNIGKELSLSHCKLIVFSEDMAKRGIKNEIYTLINNTQIRPSTNIVISKCPAKYYISNSEPLLENLISKYYELFLNSSQYTGYTCNSTIGDFFDKMLCNSCTPYAILGGINLQLPNKTNDAFTTIEANAISNSGNLEGKTSSENIGLAVFNKGIMVGELNAIETLSFMCITNQINGFLITMPDPYNEENYIDVYLKPTKKTKFDVSFVNGSPFIKLDCNFKGQIYSMTSESNYLKPEVLEDVSNACNNYMKYIITEFLYKSAKEFNADIVGIGTHSLKSFLTFDEYADYNWLENYKNSFFDVNIDVNVKSASLLSNS